VDDVVRGRRLLLVALVVTGAACRTGAGGPPVGVSPPRAYEPGTPVAVEAGTRAAPLVPADFRDHMAKVADRRPSHGHADRFDAIVWANDAARGAWDGEGDLPDGALLVEEAIERTARGDVAAGVLLMEKKDGAWRYAAAGANGDAIDPSTTAAKCAACHVDAPHDSVFRLPP
jgi:hypothetical protein